MTSLIEKFIDPKTKSIEKIYYFSAIATHLKKDVASRHKTYIEALETTSVEFIEGHFKKKQLKYKNQHLQIAWEKHEEKETDVNIGIYRVRDAVNRLFDKFILITNDTDTVLAIKMAKSENKQVEIKMLTPPTFQTHGALIKAIQPGKFVRITEGHINLSLLPHILKRANGKIIHIPAFYQRI